MKTYSSDAFFNKQQLLAKASKLDTQLEVDSI